MNDLVFLPTIDIACLIRDKEVSPVEVINAHLARIAQLNPTLNAIVDLHADEARADAQRAEQAVMRGDDLGPLHGVPMTIKSSIEVAGMLCETGSRMNAGHRPKHDATLVARLKNAGAIILGTTNCPEFLMAYETDNELYGLTRNPWALDRTPGGSSGGESAAIASGMSAGGIGSDSGGSVREPASFTGICSIKPTPGRVPGTGHVPGVVGPFDRLGCVGPMTRTITDLKQVFDVIAGFDWPDPASSPVPQRSISDHELKSLRMGYLEEDIDIPATSDVRAAVRAAAESLCKQGFTVEPFRPEGLEELRQLWWKFFCVCGAMIVSDVVRGQEDKTGPMIRDFLARMAPELPIRGPDLLNAWVTLDIVRNKILRQMQRYPILLTPVCSIPAFKHGERSWTIDGKTLDYFEIFAFTQWFNVLGAPAAVVPVSLSSEGLPIGVQVAGRPYDDELVLGIAACLERDFGFRRPPELRQSASGT